MLTRQEIHVACIHLGVILADTATSREVLTSAAIQLESLSYDLAWAIAELKAGGGKAPIYHSAHSALTAMDEGLTEMSMKCLDTEIPTVRAELEATRQNALVVLALLGAHETEARGIRGLW